MSRARYVITRLGSLLPDAIVARLYGLAVGDRAVALCLHRVLPSRRPSDPYPPTTTSRADVDALLALITPHHRRRARSRGTARLTLSFDDGYRDALDYVAARAEQYPEIEWLLFVCPEKVEKRAGFRWDLHELQGLEGRAPPPLGESLDAGLDIDCENDRAELRGLADDPRFPMVTADDLRRVSGPNIDIGNHLNSHFKTRLLDDVQVRRELLRSVATLDALVGRKTHLAFPFGTPESQLARRDVEVARTLGAFTIWSTEQRPHDEAERRAGAVLPRIVHDGTLSPRAMALFMTWRAILHRLGRRRRTLGW